MTNKNKAKGQKKKIVFAHMVPWDRERLITIRVHGDVSLDCSDYRLIPVRSRKKPRDEPSVERRK